ncbi:MAG: hypothetical protein KA369_16145 [Spirochaetes bacterium]|nr:hypothetical protein [Spirochaetota bacterium]
MATIADFIKDSCNNKQLSSSIIDQLKNATPEQLEKIFTDNGYTVSLDDCKKIIANKDSIISAGNTVQPLY